MKQYKNNPVMLVVVFMSIVLAVSCTPAVAPSTVPAALPGQTTLAISATVPVSSHALSLANPRALASRAVSSLEIPVEYPVGTSAGTISLTTVQFVLKELELEQKDDTDSSFDFKGPYLVDLIAETIDPEPAAADLPAGTYTQIKFKIDKAEDGEKDEAGAVLAASTDPIYGHSIYLAGSYTPAGGVAVPFTYTFDVDAEFELTPSGDTSVGLDIVNTAVNNVMIAFRLNRWFDGIDPAAFAANPGSFSEALKENIKLSADYGKDKNGDGKLESSEDDDPDSEDSADE